MSSLAIITARGGSKRIPGKNIRNFHGKPIIAYAIDAALRSGLFSEVMVSTDDEKIADIAKHYGATVPFMRSAETANDYATTANVLVEVLNEYATMDLRYDTACCIYPTAPFVTADKLKIAFHHLEEYHADVIFPVVKFGASIWRSLAIKADGKLHFNWPENAIKRSQDLPDAYYDCGQFYFLSVRAFLKEKSLLTTNTFGLPVSEMEVQDIDNEEDWKLAEFKFAYLNNFKINK